MGAIKMGGIVSGMDTNAIVEQLTAQAKLPITKLQGKYDIKQLEKDIYKDVSSRLGTLNSNMLTLRMESTFKTKTTDTSNSTFVGITATAEAAVGSHTINVKQIAQNSMWSSTYTRAKVTAQGAGITSFNGIPDANSNLEGKYTVNVTDQGGHHLAESSFKPNDWGSLTKQVGGALNPNFISANGDVTQNFTDTLIMTINEGSTSYDVSISVSGVVGDDMNKISKQIEEQLNAAINTKKGTNAIQYMATGTEHSNGSWSLAFYKSDIFDFSMSVSSSTGLGLKDGFTNTTSVATISKTFRADDLAGLQNKLNNVGDISGGLVKGVTLVGTLTTGSFEVTQDASLSVSSPSYSVRTGATGIATDPANALGQTLEQLGATASVNGRFSINGNFINIEDYTTMTLGNLLATINSSGAGVTASFDTQKNAIVLTDNKTGANTINLGAEGDTSRALTFLKLNSTQGATTVLGSSSASIYPTMPLNQSNITSVPTTGTFSINGVSIYIDVTKDSMNDVIKKVNLSGAGVTMVYDPAKDKVTIKSDTINPITLGSANDTSNFLQAINLKRGNVNTTETLGSIGKNAIIEVDGITYVRDSNTVDDIINGVTIDLRSASSSPVTVTINADTTKATESLATFIKTYNELMSLFNAPQLDDKQKEYLNPLTDEDRASMSEKEIETYEALHKEYNTYNIIRKSPEFRSLYSALRNTLFTEVSGLSGSISNLLQMNIDIAGDGDLSIEKLGLLVTNSTDYDEILSALNANDKLQETLKNKSDDVYEFFSANKIVGLDDTLVDDKGNRTNNENNDIRGWTRIFASVISRYTSYDGMIQKKIENTTGSLDTELNRIASQIERSQLRAEQQLERYWAQFTAMEKAIADAQAQGSALTNALSGSS